MAALSALPHDAGIKGWVVIAKEAGASREEVVTAILIGVSALGNVIPRSLALALQAYDSTKVSDERAKVK